MVLTEEEGFGLTRTQLDPLITEQTGLIFLNFPSNPTGGVATREQLEGLSELILEKTGPDVRVYSDESYEAITFDGDEHVSIASMPGMEARTIIASGVSKTYAWTGGRVGWAVYPTVREAEVHRKLGINFFASIPPYNQWGAIEALTSPESAPAIRKMVVAFQRRRDQVVAALNAIDGITCQNPKGAFYAFPNVAGVLERLGAIEAYDRLPDDIRIDTSPSTLLQLFLLHRHKVATMDRRSFSVLGSEGQHYLRISIANADDELTEAVRRIDEAASDADGFEDFMHSGVRLTL
jgi:aspartate/methionine/tyrosine aminotransferase